MSKVIGAGIVCFASTLAVILGIRLGAESMAVVVGLLCGVVASVPTSALILFLANRGKSSMMPPPAYGASGAYPTILVLPGQSVEGPSLQSSYLGHASDECMPTWGPSAQLGATPATTEIPQRQFRIIGSVVPRDGEAGDGWDY